MLERLAAVAARVEPRLLEHAAGLEPEQRNVRALSL
jgi:hypothetical protein